MLLRATDTPLCCAFWVVFRRNSGIQSDLIGSDRLANQRNAKDTES